MKEVATIIFVIWKAETGGGAWIASLLRPMIQRAVRLSGVWRGMGIGLLTCLMPCGWLYVFAITAAGSVTSRLRIKLPLLTASLVILLGVYSMTIRAPINISRVMPVQVAESVSQALLTLDESILAGESNPVIRQPGDEVAAGPTNLASPIRIRVTASGETTRLGQILKLVQSAAQDRPKIVQWADGAGAWFVVAVILLAAVTLAGWWSAGCERAVAASLVYNILAVGRPLQAGFTRWPPLP